MGVKVRGVREAKANLNRIIDNIQGRTVVREINVNGTRVTGRVGYSANYAAYVHDMPGKLKGQPRSHFGKTREGTEFGGGTGKGNYWDPHGEPQFLKKGFDEERDAITAGIKKELSL